MKFVEAFVYDYKNPDFRFTDVMDYIGVEYVLKVRAKYHDDYTLSDINFNLLQLALPEKFMLIQNSEQNYAVFYRRKY